MFRVLPCFFYQRRLDVSHRRCRPTSLSFRSSHPGLSDRGSIPHPPPLEPLLDVKAPSPAPLLPLLPCCIIPDTLDTSYGWGPCFYIRQPGHGIRSSNYATLIAGQGDLGSPGLLTDQEASLVSCWSGPMLACLVVHVLVFGSGGEADRALPGYARPVLSIKTSVLPPAALHPTYSLSFCSTVPDLGRHIIPDISATAATGCWMI